MSDKTGIEWTQAVWNPTTGCDKVSPGCGMPRFDGDDTGGCYAMAMAKRLKAMGQAKYQNDGDPRTSGPGFGLTVHPDALTIPLRWREPRMIFVNSMSDLFHKDVPDDFILQVFAVMAVTPRHTYQVLTKRHGRMRSLLSSPRFEAGVRALTWSLDGHSARRVNWPLLNVHLGVSVEDQKWAEIRIPALMQTPAAVRFLSCEPLLGPVDLGIGDPHRDHESDDVFGWPHPSICLDCSDEDGEDNIAFFRREPDARGISWVIVGGESGPGARPMSARWARMLVRECQAAGVPVFVKQLGSVLGRKMAAGSKGGNVNRWPVDLRIREFPRIPGAVAA